MCVSYGGCIIECCCVYVVCSEVWHVNSFLNLLLCCLNLSVNPLRCSLSSKCMNPAGNNSLLGSLLHPDEPYIVVPTTGIVLGTPPVTITDVYNLLTGVPRQAVLSQLLMILKPSNGTQLGAEKHSQHDSLIVGDTHSTISFTSL
jgi:hypothetical protein